VLPSINRQPRPGGADDPTRFVHPPGSALDDPTRLVPPSRGFDDRTTIVPQVRPPSRARTLLPWVGFGLVAVVVVGGTTAWAATLRSGNDALLVNAAPPAVAVSQMPVAAPSATTVEALRTVEAARPSVVRRTQAPAAPPPPVLPLPPAPTSAAAKPISVAPTAAATTTSRPTATRAPSADLPLLDGGDEATSKSPAAATATRPTPPG
jgi:hypothetical protein